MLKRSSTGDRSAAARSSEVDALVVGEVHVGDAHVEKEHPGDADDGADDVEERAKHDAAKSEVGDASPEATPMAGHEASARGGAP
jgi:hypothetical protein